MRILIYNNSTRNAAPLQRMLQQSGVRVDSCTSFDRLQYLSMVEKYVAILWIYGAEFKDLEPEFRAWKATGCTSKVIILTTKQSSLERAKVLELGFDYYFIEPYSYSKLIADVLQLGYQQAMPNRTVYRTNYFEIDLSARTAYFGKHYLTLSRTEFDLLTLLIRNRGIVLSRVVIWEEVWNYEEYPLANTIDVHINRLRKKIPTEGRSFIQTVYGMGYRMRETV